MADAKITIRYEPRGRCFWHIGCTAQRHSPPMRIGTFKEQDRQASALYCVACGEGGWFPFGRVGDVCCERIPTAGVRVDAPYHCAPEDIDALLRWLDAINDPQQEALPSLENTDWRGRAGVIARVIRYLCGTSGVATPDGAQR